MDSLVSSIRTINTVYCWTDKPVINIKDQIVASSLDFFYKADLFLTCTFLSIPEQVLNSFVATLKRVYSIIQRHSLLLIRFFLPLTDHV